jgi:hypothetical protein
MITLLAEVKSSKGIMMMLLAEVKSLKRSDN